MKIVKSYLILYICIISCDLVLLLNSINFDLVYSLEEYFHSDLILLLQKKNNNRDTPELNIYKYNKFFPKAFVGVITANKTLDDFEDVLSIPSRFKNVMIISEEIEDLAKKLIYIQKEKPNTKILSIPIWIVLVENLPTKELLDLYIPFNSRFLFVITNSSDYEITDVYQIGKNSSKIYLNFGKYNDSLQTLIQNFYSRRIDLKGFNFSIIRTKEPRFSDLWKLFSSAMNFSITWDSIPATGALYPNGTKTGLFKALDEHEIDGTPSNFIFSQIRMDHFDYIFPTYVTETKMYVASTSKLNWASFIAPFSRPVWICIFIWIILASIIKYAILRFNRFKCNPENVMLSIVKSLCYQSNSVSASSVSVYIIHLMPYFLGIVLVQYYSGVLLSYLALKETYAPFRSIQEVVNDGSYKLFLWKDSYIYYFFTTDKGEIAKTLRNRGMLHPVNDEEATLPLLCKSPAITIRSTLDYEIKTNCKISEIQEAILVDSSGMLVRKGFPYKDVLTKLMRRLQFASLVKIKQKNRIIPYENAQPTKSLPLETLFPVFLLYVSFISVSLVIFGLEVSIKQKKVGLYNRMIFFAILISIFKEISPSLDFELIYSLREYFQSDLIVLAKKENNDEIAKKLYKYKNPSPKAFMGIINIEKISKDFILPSQIARFQNIMIVSEYGKDLLQKLIDFRNDLSKIVALIVFVIFTKEDLQDQITKLYLPFNSRFLLVEERNASEYEMTEVYQIGINGSKIYSRFGTSDKKGKLNCSNQNFYFRRMDLRGHIINTELPSDPQYGRLWTMFSEKMNFTNNHVSVVYGGIFPNGTKTGIFKSIENRVIDGTQHDYKYSHQRADHFDYIIPVYIAETVTYMEVGEGLNWALFIAPFKTSVWIALLIWVVLSSITVYFTYNQFKPAHIRYNFGNSIFSVLQALFFQGNRVSSTNTSFYIACFMPHLLSIIIVYSYSGVFLSHLTIKNVSPPHNNLQGFLEEGSYKIIVEESSYPMYYFQTDQTEEAVLIREKKLLVPENEFPEFEDKKAGFQQLCHKKLIFVTGTADYSIEEKCNIMALKEIVFYDVEGIIVWRGFPYRDVMTKLLKRIQAAGLVKLRRKNTIVPYETTYKFKPLSLGSVLPIFLIHLCLTILSIILFACEIATNTYNFLMQD